MPGCELARKQLDDSQSRYIGYLRDARMKFIRLCMRARGWEIDLTQTHCSVNEADQGRCYAVAR
jgi:hypothetical protein